MSESRFPKLLKTLKVDETASTLPSCTRSPDVTDWFRLACSPPIVRRALSYAIGVGSLLIVINHGDAITIRLNRPPVQ